MAELLTLGQTGWGIVFLQCFCKSKIMSNKSILKINPNSEVLSPRYMKKQGSVCNSITSGQTGALGVGRSKEVVFLKFSPTHSSLTAPPSSAEPWTAPCTTAPVVLYCYWMIYKAVFASLFSDPRSLLGCFHKNTSNAKERAALPTPTAAIRLYYTSSSCFNVFPDFSSM